MAPEDKTLPDGPCPHCGQPVQPECETCPHCGAALPAAAEQASTRDITPRPDSPFVPGANEHPEPVTNADSPAPDDEWLDHILEDYD
jgi:hypothetical protein